MNRTFNFGEWLPWEQNASPLLLTMTLNAGMKDLREYFGMPLWTTLIIFEDNQAKWLFRPKELKVLGQKMIDFLMSPPLRSSFFEGFDHATDVVLEAAQKVQFATDLKALSNAGLIKVFDDLANKYYAWYKFGWFCEPIQFQAQDLITAVLEKHALTLPEGLSVAEAKQTLFTLEEDSFTIGILDHLRECSLALESALKSRNLDRELIDEIDASNFAQVAAQKVLLILEQDRSPEIVALGRSLKEHQNKYYWKKNNYFSTTFLSEKDILEEIFGSDGFNLSDPSACFSRELAQAKSNKEKQLRAKSALMGGLTSYYRNLVGLVGTVGGSLLDRRKRIIMIVNSAVDKIMQEVASRTSTQIGDIRYLIPQEVEYFLESPGEYQDRLDQRKEIYIVFQADFPLVPELASEVLSATGNTEINFNTIRMSDPYVAEGEHALRTLDQLNPLLNFLTASDLGGSEKIQGAVVYFNPEQPVIEGTVRIVKDPKTEIVRTGDILVAPSTTPDYMDAIRRCLAIVTDWGGQTSHAAITSRELGKPCIIGTNFASQILKNGDRVRMNFIEASVEKISA